MLMNVRHKQKKIYNYLLIKLEVMHVNTCKESHISEKFTESISLFKIKLSKITLRN